VTRAETIGSRGSGAEDTKLWALGSRRKSSRKLPGLEVSYSLGPRAITLTAV
jgi:hypothetical protein